MVAFLPDTTHKQERVRSHLGIFLAVLNQNSCDNHMNYEHYVARVSAESHGQSAE